MVLNDSTQLPNADWHRNVTDLPPANKNCKQNTRDK